MNRGWIVIGMIGALAMGFGLGRLDSEPPRELEPPQELPPRGGDRVTPEELSVKETDDAIEFSVLSKDEMFVLGYGEPSRQWRPIPPGPGSFKVPKEEMGSEWGVLGLRAKPCHCTPVDPPPGWLQDFIDQTNRVADFCDKCDDRRSQCESHGGPAEECSACAQICWGGSSVATDDPRDDSGG